MNGNHDDAAFAPRRSMKSARTHDEPSSNDPPVVPFERTITNCGDDVEHPPAIELESRGARYVVMGEFARGGLGRILTAHDDVLNRPVAIKELLSAGQTNTHQQRFEREAAITARLQHPAIVPVYDAGSAANGRPFYVMKLLGDGRTLKQVVAEAADLDARLALLPNVIAVADAIAYAHSLGIVHRDIKPSNVLLGPFGETVVIDWGLAKDLAESDAADTSVSSLYRLPAADLTATGSVLGTPCYMAPEQARGEAVGKSADVYALGALVYHVLAGAPPFAGAEPIEVVRQLASGVGPLPLDTRSGVPDDLVAIVNKAMQQDPRRRYAGAEALAEDLKRFQTGQLVRAHQYSSGALIRRWVKRNKLVSAVTALFLVVLAVTTAVSIRRIRNERSVAIAERNRLILAQAKSALDADPTLAVEWLKTYPPDGAEWDRVQILAADAQSRGVARHLLPVTSREMALFPDSKRLIVGGSGPEASVWDFVNGVRLRTRTFNSSVSAVRVSPDGETVAVTDRGGEVFAWNPRNDELRRLGTHTGAAFRVDFSRTGERLASSSRDTVAVWNVATGRQEAALPSPESITALRMAPDDDTVAFGTRNGTLELWRPASGELRRLTGHVGALNELAFSPDGREILTGGNDHTVRLWDRATGRGRILGAHDALVRQIAFSPVGTMAVSGGMDHQVRVWDRDGGARLFAGHTDVVSGVAFSPDARTIASCGKDRTVRLWDVATGEDRVLRGANSDLGDVEFSRDGAMLVSDTFDSQTRVWSVSDSPGTIVGRHGLGARYVVVSPDNRWVASADTEKFARVWDVATGQEQPLPGAEWTAMELPASPAFSADSRWLVAGGESRARVWDLTTGRTQQLVLESGSPTRMLPSADGALVVIVSTDGKLRVWSPATGEQYLLSSDGAQPIDIGFAYDGTLLSLGSDRQIRRWDLRTWRNRSLGRLLDEPLGFALTRDHRRLATADARGHIQLWDLASSEVRTLDASSSQRPQRLYKLRFSSDGHELAASSDDTTIRVWNLVGGESRTFHSHDKLVRTIAFSPDGRWLATGSEDRTIHIRDLQQGGFAVLTGHRGAVLSIGFSHDGKFLFSASEDGSVRRWQMDRIHLVPRNRDALTAWMKQQTTATLPPMETADSTARKPEENRGN
jgi:WD40 repeat protein